MNEAIVTPQWFDKDDPAADADKKPKKPKADKPDDDEPEDED